jgi:hypothetical protein
LIIGFLMRIAMIVLLARHVGVQLAGPLADDSETHTELAPFGGDAPACSGIETSRPARSCGLLHRQRRLVGWGVS